MPAAAGCWCARLPGARFSGRGVHIGHRGRARAGCAIAEGGGPRRRIIRPRLFSPFLSDPDASPRGESNAEIRFKKGVHYRAARGCRRTAVVLPSYCRRTAVVRPGLPACCAAEMARNDETPRIEALAAQGPSQGCSGELKAPKCVCLPPLIHHGRLSGLERNFFFQVLGKFCGG